MKRELLKKVLLTGVLSSSFLANAFALDNLGVNQSYFVTENGRPYSVKSEVPTDGSGWSTLFSPIGFFYQKQFVEEFGSKYIVMKNSRQVHTIDSQGEFYKSVIQYADGYIHEKGSNYFITDKGTLYIVTTTGKLKEYKNEFVVENPNDEASYMNFGKEISTAGGMFIKTESGKILIANPFTGKLDEVGRTRIARIAVSGDNYFITKKGEIYTIGFEKIGRTYRGKLTKQPLPQGVEDITISGGNYFFDQNNRVHTINDRGEINASLDSNIRISDHQNLRPKTIGSNYFMYENGNFFLVDEQGAVNFIEKRTDNIVITNRR